jgi:16S rRNA (adenine1518-N6/adenine1519-N6)-dimethyltransferase
LELKHQIPEFAGMFQKKWQSCICRKGSKAYGIFTLASFYDVEYLFTVDEHVLFRHQSEVRRYAHAPKSRLQFALPKNCFIL